MLSRLAVTIALLLAIAPLAAQDPSFRTRFGRARIPTGEVVPPPNPTGAIDIPTSSPIHATAEATLDVGGTCVDQDGTITQAELGCPECTPTSRTDTTIVDDRWLVNFGLAVGANVITLVCRDNASNGSAPQILTVTRSAGADTTDPETTLTTGNHGVTTDSTTLVGTASDNVAVALVRWENTTNSTSGTCSGTTSYSCDVTGLAVGANTVRTIARDASGNEDETPPSITVTYTPPLVWATAAGLGTFRTTDDTTRQLSCTGGVGAISYTEVIDGGDVLGAADCADIALGSSGLLTIATPPAQPVTCTFTVRCTDSNGTPQTADREFTLIVNDAAETAHEYFEGLGKHANLFAQWSLRSQSQINGLDNVGSGDNPSFSYDPASDTHAEQQDAMKLTVPGPSADIPTQHQLVMPVSKTSGTVVFIHDVYWTSTFRTGPRTGCSPTGSTLIANYKSFNVVQGSGNRWWTHVTRFNMGSDDVVTSVGELYESLDNITPKPEGNEKREPYTPVTAGTEPPRTYQIPYSTWIRYIYEIRLNVPAASSLWDDYKAINATTATLSGTWHMLSLWVMVEGGSTTPVRELYRVPWGFNPGVTTLYGLIYEMNSSSNNSPSCAMHLYGRNVSALYWASNTDGLSEADTTIFKRPVR